MAENDDFDLLGFLGPKGKGRRAQVGDARSSSKATEWWGGANSASWATEATAFPNSVALAAEILDQESLSIRRSSFRHPHPTARMISSRRKQEVTELKIHR